MSNDITYIGVDIAKEKFDICVYSGSSSSLVYETYSNDLDGFFSFLSLIKLKCSLENVRIGFEATSTYMTQLQIYLDKAKIKYILINPKQIHHYIKYKNYESKTDKLDSYYIADYITTLEDKKFNSSHSKIKFEYKTIQAYTNLIIKTQTHIKWLEASILNDDFTNEDMKKDLLDFKSFLKKQKNKYEIEQVKLAKQAMPEYEYIKNDLQGVGDKTLCAVLPLIYDTSTKYTQKQIQSFLGFNIVYNDSGSSVNKKQRMSKSGNSYARRMLYMSAVSSVQRNSFLKDKYNRLIENGKPSKVALVAISSHILRAIVTKLNYYKSLNDDKNR